MKVLLLTDAVSAHSKKWIYFLREYGVEVEVLSMSSAAIDGVHQFRSRSYNKRKSNVDYNRGRVLLEIIPQLKSRIRKIKPDIVHSHYLSSYGLYGALSGFHPFVLSVWGSDIMEFPYRGRVSKTITQYVLKKADLICASSNHLLKEIGKFTAKPVNLVYFGTDFDSFSPAGEKKSLTKYNLPDFSGAKKPFIFGTVKGLYAHYGIEYLLEAAAVFSDRLKDENRGKEPDSNSPGQVNNENDNLWELWIGGDGDSRQKLEALARNLGISDRVRFLGRVEHDDLPALMDLMDVFVVPSLRESFGVVAVEASACCKPVIVTNTGGLPETIEHNKTGFCVEAGDHQAIADKLMLLYGNSGLRKRMGEKGREYCKNRFHWAENANKMIDIYKSIYKSRIK